MKRLLIASAVSSVVSWLWMGLGGSYIMAACAGMIAYAITSVWVR